MRRRREKLALDNVRLGRIVTTRTNLGGTSHVESWEGGYRKHELERQKLHLNERKEELESRRKRITALKKRAARKAGGNVANDAMLEYGLGSEGGGSAFSSVIASSGSSSSLAALTGAGSVTSSATSVTAGSSNSSNQERDVMDNEMDLNTETEVIRIHLEQLKR